MSGSENLPTVEEDASSAKHSETSQTAAEFIQSQLALEAEAREALPYSISTCTYSLGPLRQSLFSCLTCNPVGTTPAGICYSCSVQCHGTHTLVEIFSKRNFVCDCGTTRFKSPCTLRPNEATGEKGATGDLAAAENSYGDNFWNLFCKCRREYVPEKEKGTMFQCIGLTGGCGEDWYHPSCLIGLGPDWVDEEFAKKEKERVSKDESDKPTVEGEDAEEEEEDDDEEPPLPPGFPDEDSFEHFICYKCVQANPWVKRYVGQPGLLPPVFTEPSDPATKDVPKPTTSQTTEAPATDSKKRKATSPIASPPGSPKRTKAEPTESTTEAVLSTPADPSIPDTTPIPCRLPPLSSVPPAPFSLFLTSDFRDSLCSCPTCTETLAKYPYLLTAETLYEPSLSASSVAPSTADKASLYSRGESALATMDRVKAIEGVMAYNMMKEKLAPFFKEFAESGKAISADDVKDYFARLRGDTEGMKEAQRKVGHGEGSSKPGNSRREQEGQ